MRKRLTKRFIDSQSTPPKGEIIWDEDRDAPRGFGIRIKPSGTKTFLIQWRDKRGNSARFTVGQYGRLTLEQARVQAQKLFRNITDGIDPREVRREDREAVTVSALCDEYLEAATSGLVITRQGGPKKSSTLATDRGRIERHIKPLLGKKLVKELQSADIQVFVNKVTAGKTAADIKTGVRGRAIVTGGRGTATRTTRLLSGILTYARNQGIRSDNPVHGVRLHKDNKRTVELNPSHYLALATLLEKAKEAGEPWQAVEAIRLLALTGCRLGDVQNLRWSEVDLSLHCLCLADSKTGASVRPIGQHAVDLLSQLRSISGGEYVFTGRKGQPFKGLPKALKRIVGDGIQPGFSAHWLRHGFASVGANIGLPEHMIGALTGHKAHSVTRQYMHLDGDILRRAADKVTNEIAAAMAGETGSWRGFDRVPLPMAGQRPAAGDNVVRLKRRA